MADETASTGSAKPALFVECVSRDRALYARLVGPSVGQRESAIIRDEVVREIENADAPVSVLILDFRRIGFMNSMGLSMCTMLRNHMAERGGTMVLYRLSDQIVSVLKMMKMDRLFTIVSDPAGLEKTLKKLTPRE